MTNILENKKLDQNQNKTIETKELASALDSGFFEDANNISKLQSELFHIEGLLEESFCDALRSAYQEAENGAPTMQNQEIIELFETLLGTEPRAMQFMKPQEDVPTPHLHLMEGFENTGYNKLMKWYEVSYPSKYQEAKLGAQVKHSRKPEEYHKSYVRYELAKTAIMKYMSTLEAEQKDMLSTYGYTAESFDADAKTVMGVLEKIEKDIDSKYQGIEDKQEQRQSYSTEVDTLAKKTGYDTPGIFQEHSKYYQAYDKKLNKSVDMEKLQDSISFLENPQIQSGDDMMRYMEAVNVAQSSSEIMQQLQQEAGPKMLEGFISFNQGVAKITQKFGAKNIEALGKELSEYGEAIDTLWKNSGVDMKKFSQAQKHLSQHGWNKKYSDAVTLHNRIIDPQNPDTSFFKGVIRHGEEQKQKQAKTDSWYNYFKVMSPSAYQALQLGISGWNSGVDGIMGTGSAAGIWIMSLYKDDNELSASLDFKEKFDNFLKINQSTAMNEPPVKFYNEKGERDPQLNFTSDNTAGLVGQGLASMYVLLSGARGVGMLAQFGKKGVQEGMKKGAVQLTKANMRKGLFTSAMIQQSGRSFIEAKQQGLSDLEASGYGLIMSTAGSALEMIAPNQLFFGQWKNVLGNLAGDGAEKSFYKMFAKHMSLELFEENVQESAQLALQLFGNRLYNGIYDIDMHDNWSWQEFASTAIITTLTTGIISTKGGIQQAQMDAGMSDIQKKELIESIKADPKLKEKYVKQIDKIINNEVHMSGANYLEMKKLKEILEGTNTKEMNNNGESMSTQQEVGENVVEFDPEFPEKHLGDLKEFASDHIKSIENNVGRIDKNSLIYKKTNHIFQKIVKTSGIDNLQLNIVNTPEPNAYLIGGTNQIYLHYGLIIELQQYLKANDKYLSEDHLAAIIGHEIQHAKQKLYDFEKKRTKKSEYNADHQGMEMMIEAGYNPYAFLDIFECFYNLGGGATKFASLADEHPFAKDRQGMLNYILNFSDRNIKNRSKTFIKLEEIKDVGIKQKLYKEEKPFENINQEIDAMKRISKWSELTPFLHLKKGDRLLSEDVDNIKHLMDGISRCFDNLSRPGIAFMQSLLLDGKLNSIDSISNEDAFFIFKFLGSHTNMVIKSKGTFSNFTHFSNEVFTELLTDLGKKLIKEGMFTKKEFFKKIDRLVKHRSNAKYVVSESTYFAELYPYQSSLLKDIIIEESSKGNMDDLKTFLNKINTDILLSKFDTTHLSDQQLLDLLMIMKNNKKLKGIHNHIYTDRVNSIMSKLPKKLFLDTFLNLYKHDISEEFQGDTHSKPQWRLFDKKLEILDDQGLLESKNDFLNIIEQSKSIVIYQTEEILKIIAKKGFELNDKEYLSISLYIDSFNKKSVSKAKSIFGWLSFCKKMGNPAYLYKDGGNLEYIRRDRDISKFNTFVSEFRADKELSTRELNDLLDNLDRSDIGSKIGYDIDDLSNFLDYSTLKILIKKRNNSSRDYRTNPSKLQIFDRINDEVLDNNEFSKEKEDISNINLINLRNIGLNLMYRLYSSKEWRENKINRGYFDKFIELHSDLQIKNNELTDIELNNSLLSYLGEIANIDIGTRATIIQKGQKKPKGKLTQGEVFRDIESGNKNNENIEYNKFHINPKDIQKYYVSKNDLSDFVASYKLTKKYLSVNNIQTLERYIVAMEKRTNPEKFTEFNSFYEMITDGSVGFSAFKDSLINSYLQQNDTSQKEFRLLTLEYSQNAISNFSTEIDQSEAKNNIALLLTILNPKEKANFLNYLISGKKEHLPKTLKVISQNQSIKYDSLHENFHIMTKEERMKYLYDFCIGENGILYASEITDEEVKHFLGLIDGALYGMTSELNVDFNLDIFERDLEGYKNIGAKNIISKYNFNPEVKISHRFSYISNLDPKELDDKIKRLNELSDKINLGKKEKKSAWDDEDEYTSAKDNLINNKSEYDELKNKLLKSFEIEYMKEVYSQFTSKISNKAEQEKSNLSDPIQTIGETSQLLIKRFLSKLYPGSKGKQRLEENIGFKTFLDGFIKLSIENAPENVKNNLSKSLQIIFLNFPANKRFKLLTSLIEEIGTGNDHYSVKVKKLFEQFGPVGVKTAQYLANKPDVLPDDKIREQLATLKDEANPMNKSAFFELVQDIDSDNFTVESIGTRLGSASMKQVHQVTIKTKDGETKTMVAKFIRPNIIEDLEVNLSVAKQLAKAFGIKDLSQEFKNIILEEVNLDLEVYNTKLLKKTIDGKKFGDYAFSVPDVVYVDDKMIIEEQADGVNLKKAMESGEIKDNKIYESIIQSYFHQLIVSGVFHADLHEGNIFVDGKTITLIDCGLIGNIDKAKRGQFLSLFRNIEKADAKKVADAVDSKFLKEGKLTSKQNKIIQDFVKRGKKIDTTQEASLNELFQSTLKGDKLKNEIINLLIDKKNELGIQFGSNTKEKIEKIFNDNETTRVQKIQQVEGLLLLNSKDKFEKILEQIKRNDELILDDSFVVFMKSLASIGTYLDNVDPEKIMDSQTSRVATRLVVSNNIGLN